MRASEEIEAAERDAESAENLGTRLRRAREAQDVSLDVISAELRIAVPALVALEECRFEALGPAVFAKGYLKQYGTRLGLDVAELVAEYERSVGGGGPIEIAPSRSIRLRDERQITIWIVAVIVLALIAALLAVWWWLGRDFGSADTAAPAVTESLAPVADIAPRPVTPDGSGGGANEPAPGGSSSGAIAPAVAEPSPSPPDRSGSDVAGANTEPADSSAQPVAAALTGPTLEIVFLDDSWADITDETGARLYYGLGRAGTRATLPADRRLNLFFGYADGVSLSIDGEPFPIPASARRRDDLAQFNLEAQVSRNP